MTKKPAWLLLLSGCFGNDQPEELELVFTRQRVLKHRHLYGACVTFMAAMHVNGSFRGPRLAGDLCSAHVHL